MAHRKTCDNCAYSKPIHAKQWASWVTCEWKPTEPSPFWYKPEATTGALSPTNDRSLCKTWKEKKK